MTIFVLGTIIAFLLPQYYRSTAILLPETDKSKLPALSGLSDLASLAGMSTGETPLTRLYPTILRSETILGKAILKEYSIPGYKQPVNLIVYWDISGSTDGERYERALQRLRNELEISMDTKTLVVSMAIETTEPALSADILNTITTELDRFMRTKKATNASEQRRWVETRLGEVQKSLEQSEEAMKTFREQNRIVQSPQLLMEQERRLREVQLNSTVFLELKKQYELARIEEIKNMPIINVLDPARPASLKERPKRFTFVIMSGLFGFCLASAFVLLRHRYPEQTRHLMRSMRLGGKK